MEKGTGKCGGKNVVTDRMLDSMIRLGVVDRNDAEIYRFGLEAMVWKTFHYASYLLIAFFCGETVCFLYFFLSFLLLRKNGGGYHAKTKAECYVLSCLMVFGTVVCMKVVQGWNGWNHIVHMGSVGWLLALVAAADFIIFITAPLGNRNRELEEEEKRYFRKRTRGLLVGENILVVLLGLAGKAEYAVAVAMAVMWEASVLLAEKIREGSPRAGVKRENNG